MMEMVTCNLCSECGAEFPSRNKLFKHVRSFHRDNDFTPLPSSEKGRDGEKEREREDLAIVYSDHWLLIACKPQGMCAQRERRDEGRQYSLPSSPKLLLSSSEHQIHNTNIGHHTTFVKARPAHRIDKATGGLVLCTKSKEADCAIKEMFRNRKISKRYLAIVSGKVNPPQGTIDFPLDSKQCLTHYSVLGYSRSGTYGEGWITTVQLIPVTGRKHQLRRHMQMIGYPIVGDEKHAKLPLPLSPQSCPYGTGLNVLYLWSVEMRFPHPFLTDRTDTLNYVLDEGISSSCEHDHGCDNDIASENKKLSNPTITQAGNQAPIGSVNIKQSDGNSLGDVFQCGTHRNISVEIPEPATFTDLRKIEEERWMHLQCTEKNRES